jgi:small subunit ribosomal protein S20
MLSVGFRATFGLRIQSAFAVEILQHFGSHPGRSSISRTSNFYTQEKVIHVANIKSQIKRIGTNKKAQDRNRAVKSELKTAIRATHKAVAAGDKATAATSLTLAGKKLDKAVSKGVIHKNQAANRKSAIAKQVAAL